MRRGPRGGPGQFAARVARAEQLLVEDQGAAREPLAVLVAVLRYQQGRSGPRAVHQADPDRFPRLDLAGAAEPIADEVGPAVAVLGDAVPEPLGEAGHHLRALAPTERAAVAETWLDDATLVEARLGFWIQVAAGPVLEGGAADVVAPRDWNGAACPVCGGSPQASAIAEESGEFMAGSPRSLVCGRCASWWPFPRVTCMTCGEEDPRRIEAFMVEHQRWARVDTCATCRSYIKTFDLRVPGAVDVVPLVDDVATLTLDVWARDHGFSRPALSLAGV